MKQLIALLILLGLAADAEACNRCGLFGNRCRFAVRHHAPVYHAPVAKVITPYVAPQNVYVIQNSYPAPLVPSGGTQYASTGSYQSIVGNLLDPNAYFAQELALLKAANDTNALRAERSSQLFQRVAELQAPYAEKLATGAAAKMVLDAAGLNSATQQQTSNAVVIRRDEYGKLQVSQLSPEQIAAMGGKQPDAPAPPEPGGKYPLLGQFCSSCHGLNLAEPKSGFYLGDDPAVAKSMREKFFGITQQLRSGKMPPASSPQPTNEQRAGILDEIEQIVLQHAKE